MECELTLSLTRQFLRGVFLSTYCLSGNLHPPAGTQFDPLSLRRTYLLFLSWTGIHMSSFCADLASHSAWSTSREGDTLWTVRMQLTDSLCNCTLSSSLIQYHWKTNDITLPRLWIFFPYHSDVYNSQGLRFPGIADFYAINWSHDSHEQWLSQN